MHSRCLIKLINYCSRPEPNFSILNTKNREKKQKEIPKKKTLRNLEVNYFYHRHTILTNMYCLYK